MNCIVYAIFYYKIFFKWIKKSISTNKDYLNRGIEAYKCYNNTYLTHSLFAGGALDTYCIDKESAGPMLKDSLLLY